MNSDSREQLIKRKETYRAYARKLPLNERLKQLESLQEQSYEIMRIREANGGKPVSEGWRRWAQAQEELAIKK